MYVLGTKRRRKGLIDEIIDCDLMENHLFVKRVWTRTYSLNKHDDFSLLQNGTFFIKT